MSKAIVDLKASNGVKVRASVAAGGQEPFVWLSQEEDSSFNRKDFDRFLEEMLDLRLLLWGPK